jgi:hypothetical protein
MKTGKWTEPEAIQDPFLRIHGMVSAVSRVSRRISLISSTRRLQDSTTVSSVMFHYDSFRDVRYSSRLSMICPCYTIHYHRLNEHQLINAPLQVNNATRGRKLSAHHPATSQSSVLPAMPPECNTLPLWFLCQRSRPTTSSAAYISQSV